MICFVLMSDLLVVWWNSTCGKVIKRKAPSFWGFWKSKKKVNEAFYLRRGGERVFVTKRTSSRKRFVFGLETPQWYISRCIKINPPHEKEKERGIRETFSFGTREEERGGKRLSWHLEKREGEKEREREGEKENRKKNVFVFVFLRVLVLLSAVHAVEALSRTGCKWRRCSELNLTGGDVGDTELRREEGDVEEGKAGWREGIQKAARSW